TLWPAPRPGASTAPPRGPSRPTTTTWSSPPPTPWAPPRSWPRPWATRWPSWTSTTWGPTFWASPKRSPPWTRSPRSWGTTPWASPASPPPWGSSGRRNTIRAQYSPPRSICFAAAVFIFGAEEKNPVTDGSYSSIRGFSRTWEGRNAVFLEYTETIKSGLIPDGEPAHIAIGNGFLLDTQKGEAFQVDREKI